MQKRVHTLKRLLSLLILLLFSFNTIFSQSLFDDSLSLFDDSLNPYSDDLSLFDDDLSLFDQDKDLVSDEKSLFDKSKNIMDDGGYGIYETSKEKAYVSNKESNYESSVITVVEDPYIGEYGRFLAVTADTPEARKKFINYFTDWQNLGLNGDFFEYAGSRAQQEKAVEYCYDAALKKFGAGTAIIATTWVVAFVLPGGTIYQAAVIIIAKATTVGALSGSAMGAVTSAGVAVIQGKTGEELLYETVKGAADGYLVGAITGLLEGSGKVYKFAKEAKSLKDFSGTKTIFNNKVYDANGKLVGKYNGEVTQINGRSIINQGLVNQKSEYGIPYKYYLADDGNGNFFKVVNPDFTDVKIVDKVYKVPRNLWNDTEAAKAWCREAYKKDLADPNVTKILGISKKEAAMRLQYEKGYDLYDSVFIKANKLTEKQINEFLKRYSSGAWHHLPSSGELIYVPKNHNVLAPHTGGDSFWGSKLTSASAEAIEW